MKAAFYKGKSRLFNRLVSWWTRGPYSHMELVLDDGVSVSSSSMDGGLRHKRIDFTDGRWDFIELGAETSDVRDRIAAVAGMKYDYRGLFGFVIRSMEDDRKKMFCSEACMYFLGYPESWRFDPNTAYAVLNRDMANGS